MLDYCEQLSKEEFQALINARVQHSVSERAAALAAYNASAEKAQVDAEAARANREAATLTRYSAVYRTPSGQAIRFDPPKRASPTKVSPPLPPPTHASAGGASSTSNTVGGTAFSTPGTPSWGVNEAERRQEEQQRLRNTPPTPKFGAGKSIQRAADVQWSFYEAVHPKPPPLTSSDQGVPSEQGLPSTPGLPSPQWGPQNGTARSFFTSSSSASASQYYGAAKSLSSPAGQRLDHQDYSSSSSGRVLSTSAPSSSHSVPGFSRWGPPGGGGRSGSNWTRSGEQVGARPASPPTSLPTSPPLWPVAPVHAQATLAKRTIWDPSWGVDLPARPAPSETADYDVAAAAAEALFSSSAPTAQPPAPLLSSSLGQVLAGNLSAPSPHNRPSANLGTDLSTGIGWSTESGGDFVVDGSGFEVTRSSNGRTPRSVRDVRSKAVGATPRGSRLHQSSVQDESARSAAMPVPKQMPRFGTPSPREQSTGNFPDNDGSDNDTVDSDDDDDDGEFEIQFGFGF